MILHISPTDLAALLAAGAPHTASRYLARVLSLPAPSRAPGQARLMGDPRGVAAVLAALLAPRCLLRIADTAVAVGATVTVTVVRCGTQDVFHVVADDADPATVAVRALTAELGGRDHLRLTLGRWTPSGEAEHQILVDAADLAEVAADLLGLDGTPATTR
ncbi:MAG: hypothetical protein Q4C85_07320 [Actinomyces sp.]|uniref:hypothetical protein n=1 Tax=Actinomyces sp. TaxID=29317 RepID=UPI0026DD10FB|nr:hypothetical protein [Actinomyces sp.]MDO4243553.1 hypothetical protein [Actinomyces sp.]